MSSVYTPLLSDNHSENSENTKDLSKLQPCANFLLNSDNEVWYIGRIYKQKPSGIFAKITQTWRNFVDEKYKTFVSYKFVHKERTFCLTFKKKQGADGDSILGNNSDYHITVSLIEQDDNGSVQQRQDNKTDSRATKIDNETPIKCRGSESLIIKTIYKDGNFVFEESTTENPKFLSITSGDTPDEMAVVRGMGTVFSEGHTKYSDFFDTYIKNNMDNLGKTLVDHCENPNSSLASSGGGATRIHTRLTRRRKGVFKRKGKKSYKKKKYGKTKKSRRFRRSGRSRR